MGRVTAHVACWWNYIIITMGLLFRCVYLFCMLYSGSGVVGGGLVGWLVRGAWLGLSAEVAGVSV